MMVMNNTACMMVMREAMIAWYQSCIMTNESTMPRALPRRQTMIDSSMTIRSTLNRLAPMARSMPISLVLSDTDITMTIRVTMPATMSMTALMPPRKVLVLAIMSLMLSSRSFCVRTSSSGYLSFTEASRAFMASRDAGASSTVVTDGRLNVSWAVDKGIMAMLLTMNELE